VKGPKAAVVGYCFTGTMSVRTAAAAPDRIAAAASFHGGGLYTDQSDSPHLPAAEDKKPASISPRVQDRSMPTETIAKFEAVLKAWPGQSESETYEGALHGWCVRARHLQRSAGGTGVWEAQTRVLEAAPG